MTSAAGFPACDGTLPWHLHWHRLESCTGLGAALGAGPPPLLFLRLFFFFFLIEFFFFQKKKLKKNKKKIKKKKTNKHLLLLLWCTGWDLLSIKNHHHHHREKLSRSFFFSFTLCLFSTASPLALGLPNLFLNLGGCAPPVHFSLSPLSRVLGKLASALFHQEG